MPILRIPYTEPLPPPRIIPASASTLNGAIEALTRFLSLPPPPPRRTPLDRTLLLTGAGISVASGLADYRGTNGTYTLNKKFRPVYYHEFISNHEARKRYWARSFLGWTTLNKARPNAAHHAVGQLGQLGVFSKVITQNVDSFHPIAHPSLPTIELHGYLRSLVCVSCQNAYPRDVFQTQLAALNPSWAAFLSEILASGALDTEDLEERSRRGLRTNPDGDVEIPDAPYSTFRYPACPTCLAGGVVAPTGDMVHVDVDRDGAWLASSTGGVLKPAVIMFGESISEEVKRQAEEAVDEAGRVLIVGSSLATYSAWRLVKKAKELGRPVGILNMGGVRGEQAFFADVPQDNDGRLGVRCDVNATEVLPEIVRRLEKSSGKVNAEAIG